LRNGETDVEFPASVDVLELVAAAYDCSVGAADPRWAVGDTVDCASKAGDFEVESLRDLGLERELEDVSMDTSVILSTPTVAVAQICTRD
jgi:hypothetical protein